MNDRLSLQGSASATVGHFEAALAALQLQTVRFKDDSTRTISVSPNVAGDVPKKDFYVREVKVGASPIEPLLSVRGFTKRLATAERYLMLSESHILVDDVDTVLGDGNVDASNITLRITELLGGTLEKRISASADWAPMSEVSIGGISQGYYAFTLADLQSGLVSVKASAGVSSLTFKVQAADNENNFSLSDTDRTSVSIPVVALKEVEAGQKGALNDDRPRGGLTPDAVTLQAWLDADSTLEIFVELQGAKSGIVVLEEGAVEESLSLSGSVTNITATWDGTNDRLSLQGDASATVGNFEAALAALQLQTVRFKEDSYRTISVRPNINVDVPKKDFYVREVKVEESPKEPLLSVRGFAKILATAERPVVLGESHILVDDMDTRDSLDPTKVDASRIKFRITNIRNGKLMRRPDTSSPWVDVDLASGTQYREFGLADLQGGLVSLEASALASTLTFDIQAVDDENNFSDSDRNDNQNDADPASVSISVVALKKVEAGEKVALNDDSPRGGLTPDANTLQAWLAADGTLEIFVKLQGGRSGIVVLGEGAVEESLSLSGSVSNITVTWDAVNDRLSLQGNASVRASDVEAALAALQLQTVRFKDDSYRTISISPNVAEDVLKKDFYVREVKVGGSPKEPLLSVRFGKLRVDSGQRLILGEEHILVDDVDTRDVNDNVDASKITLRITGLTGGELQSRSSSSESDWAEISLHGSNTYLEFTLADLKAGKISILAGNGIAKADGGEGEKITFQVQAADAADNTANLSDSDPNDDDADPADAEILVITSVRTTAGYRSLLNADGALTPDTTILNSWQQNPAGATLRVIVKLSNKQPGDVLSLQSGYDVSKIAPQWDQATGELSLEIGSGTTTAEIVTALELLEFKSVLVDSASTREVWVFPSLSGVGTFRSRLDEATGLMRYYLLVSTERLFAVASTFASQSIFFGKHGYLGVPTSDAEKSVYRALRTRYRYIHLAISDSVEEGKWLVTAGPRKDMLFWDHTAGKYGPGAAGSGWNARSNFWSGSNPYGGDYAYMDGNGVFGDTSGNFPRRSIIHHDLWLNKGEIVARLVEVKESSSSPVLEVDFSKLQATSQRPLILTEDHIWVDDLDTRNPSDDTKVDPAKITFRVMGIAGGTLRARADAAGTWEAIPPKGTVGSEYREFTLAQLQDGLVSLLPDAGISTLTFRIQARDDGLPGTPGSLAHLSDSDPYDDENDADPESVSIRVVALKEIDAGKEMPVNDDRKSTGGNGALTPDDATLGAWISATTNRELRVFVKLEGGRKGDVLFPEDGHGITSIASSWDWDDSNSIGTLSLQSDGTATSDHFQAILNALALRSVRFASASFATISVRPDIAAEVPRKDYYARDVLVRESGPRPYVGEQQSTFLRFRRNGPTVLSSSEFLVEDFDTLASNVTIVMRNLTSTATLQKKDNNGVYQDITPESDASLEFTLEELQQGLIAMYLPELVPQTIAFTLEARDDQWTTGTI